MLIRRDYAVVEPQRLRAHAQRIEAADDDESTETSGTVHGALGLLFGEFEPDEIASRHTEFGLEEGDSTLWVAASDEPAEPGEWLESPFEQVDPQQVVCRFDVSAVFDDEDLEDDLDDELDPSLDEDEDEDLDPLDATTR
ncbi:hypothetical protein SHKM778_65350 [Streptomyces sp. KM77-8]|uniref:DUF3027 domain-containing protein n=1 Tax=Streptomyces haneummycinicus TaxID=3074435 RepID=A0AAT9HRS1_9ACTN